MSDVQFDTDQFKAPMSTAIGFTQAENKMSSWLMRSHLVANESQAQLVLVGVIVGTLALAAIAWFIMSPHTAQPDLAKVRAAMEKFPAVPPGRF